MMLDTSGEFHKGQVCLVFLFIQWINVQQNKVCSSLKYILHSDVSHYGVFSSPSRTAAQGLEAHTHSGSFFQVLFNITYANGQVYLNDFPMKSGVSHITCQTIICEYSLLLFLFFLILLPPLGYLASLLFSNQSLQWPRVLYFVNQSIVEAKHFAR